MKLLSRIARALGAGAARIGEAVNRALLAPRNDMRRETFEQVLADRSLTALGVLLDDPAGRESIILGPKVTAYVFKLGREHAMAQDAKHRMIPVSLATALKLRQIFNELPLTEGGVIPGDNHIRIREEGSASATLAAAQRMKGADIAARARRKAEEVFGGA